jgi:hypothetical protein
VDVSVEINCEICGSANYSLPGGEADNGAVLCNDCGAAQGTLGELKAALLDRVVAQSAEALRAKADALRETLPAPSPMTGNGRNSFRAGPEPDA